MTQNTPMEHIPSRAGAFFYAIAHNQVQDRLKFYFTGSSSLFWLSSFSLLWHLTNHKACSASLPTTFVNSECRSRRGSHSLLGRWGRLRILIWLPFVIKHFHFIIIIKDAMQLALPINKEKDITINDRLFFLFLFKPIELKVYSRLIKIFLR